MAKVVVAHRADGDEASRSELTTASAFPIEHNVCNDRLLSPASRCAEGLQHTHAAAAEVDVGDHVPKQTFSDLSFEKLSRWA
jgi:hypothetical protein